MRTLTPLSLLTIHRAPLWLGRGRCRATAGNSEVGRQGIWCTQGHPPHVFGPELLSPWGSTAEVLIIILEYDEVKKKGGKTEDVFSPQIFLLLLSGVNKSANVRVCHLFHSPVCAHRQQTAVFTLKSGPGLQRKEKKTNEINRRPALSSSSCLQSSWSEMNFGSH